MKNKDFDNKNIKKEFPTLEDLMFKNKVATRNFKKKKAFKKFQQFKNEQREKDI